MRLLHKYVATASVTSYIRLNSLAHVFPLHSITSYRMDVQYLNDVLYHIIDLNLLFWGILCNLSSALSVVNVL